jgi:hypothetical protein
LPHHGVERSPSTLTAFGRSDYLAALGAAVAVLAFYVSRLSVAITGEDAGELAAAAYVLGVPHPPGYPLWCLLAHPFTWLPVLTVAWRVALCSVVLGAGTVFLVVLLGKRLSGARTLSVAAALALAISPDFLGQSTIPEVYTLNTLLFVASWLLLALWHEGRNDRYLWGLAVVQGLNFGNHNTAIALAPLFAAFVLLVDWPVIRMHAVKRLRLYAVLSALSVLIAFALYAYLPLRSLANPPIDWGNPESLSNWWRHFTRGQYEFMVWEHPRSLGRMVAHVQALAGTLVLFGYVPLLFCGSVAVGLCAVRKHVLTLCILGTALFVSVVFTIIQNPDATREWVTVMRVFHLPFYVALALCIPVAFAAMMKAREVCVLTLVFFSPMLFQTFLFPHPKPGTAEAYARRELSLLPEDAIVVPHADHQSFPAQYLQVVEGLRPDVVIARKYGYLDMSLFPPELREKYGEFPPRRFEPELLQWLVEHSEVPVYFFKRPRFPSLEVEWETCWLMERALLPGQATVSCGELEGVVNYYEVRSWGPGSDYTVSVIAQEECQRAAAAEYDAGEFKAAIGMIEDGLAAYGRDTTSLYNAGVFFAKRGERKLPRKYFEEALTLDPSHEPSREGVARLSAD